MKGIWTNHKGEKIPVKILTELTPLNMPKKYRVQKETAEEGHGIFLVNKDQVEVIAELRRSSPRRSG